MSLGHVTLKWIDNSTDESEQRIYRSEVPFTEESLPVPIATVGPNITQYVDTTVEANKTYYYRVGAYRGSNGVEMVSEQYEVSTANSFGPGPSELLFGGSGQGFFGEVAGSELITMGDLTTRMGVTEGTAQNLDDPWLKFVLDGKILYVSKRPIRHSISWDHLNLKNVVYGDTNIFIRGNEFKVRLLKGADTDPSVNLTGNYLEGTHNSEWSRLFYPLVSDDQYLIDQYTGPKYPSYTNLELGMLYVDATTNGTYSWCQETHPGTTNGRVFRGRYGVSYLSRSSSSTGASYGWRPCLELVP